MHDTARQRTFIGPDRSPPEVISHNLETGIRKVIFPGSKLCASSHFMAAASINYRGVGRWIVKGSFNVRTLGTAISARLSNQLTLNCSFTIFAC